MSRRAVADERRRSGVAQENIVRLAVIGFRVVGCSGMSDRLRFGRLVEAASDDEAEASSRHSSQGVSLELPALINDSSLVIASPSVSISLVRTVNFLPYFN